MWQVELVWIVRQVTSTAFRSVTSTSMCWIYNTEFIIGAVISLVKPLIPVSSTLKWKWKQYPCDMLAVRIKGDDIPLMTVSYDST